MLLLRLAWGAITEWTFDSEFDVVDDVTGSAGIGWRGGWFAFSRFLASASDTNRVFGATDALSAG